ncbi:CBS domain-containing protein [Paenibacillus hexagrammi]|uniref:CBS domain-containing protein n=1 Tax=Paenibacillus hexagrammi TaxID=2908839 RepID=A0ABY3SG16_9BACL|nr:CBS domain-containing protein [Paenibacillus sp. YPD9-1]UJF32917.1 CBS domain-containing protein [Paenibacillus sp. YPD9-1]
MKASDIMITPVVKALETDTIRTVLEKFVNQRIGGVPIVDHANQIKGYISDGDIMRAVSTQSKVFIASPFYTSAWLDTQTLEEKYHEILDLCVMEFAKTKVVTVNVNTELEDVATILGRRHLKKVVVEKNGGYLAGVISRGDMVRFLSRHCSKKLLS